MTVDELIAELQRQSAAGHGSLHVCLQPNSPRPAEDVIVRFNPRTGHVKEIPDMVNITGK